MREDVGVESDRDAVIDDAFRAHAADVYRLAFSITRDRSAAEDVVQDTFARAFDRFAAYDSGRPIGAWLHGIAAHLAVDQARRSGARRRLALAWPRPAAEPDAASALAERDAAARLLDELPPRTRAMLVLRHAYGYDDRSVAGLVGTSPGNVRTQLSRAHARLRALLEADERGADDAPEQGRTLHADR
jgi:RNA polymerase sigma-70 factor (ECF subfamily)